MRHDRWIWGQLFPREQSAGLGQTFKRCHLNGSQVATSLTSWDTPPRLGRQILLGGLMMGGSVTQTLVHTAHPYLTTSAPIRGARTVVMKPFAAQELVMSSSFPVYSKIGPLQLPLSGWLVPQWSSLRR